MFRRAEVKRELDKEERIKNILSEKEIQGGMIMGN